MIFVSDIDAEDEYFVFTVSARQHQAIKKIGSYRYKTSTSHAHVDVASISRSYAETIIDDQTRGDASDVTEDDIEASIPGMSIDPTLFTNYSTHVTAFIW